MVQAGGVFSVVHDDGFRGRADTPVQLSFPGLTAHPGNEIGLASREYCERIKDLSFWLLGLC